MLLRYKFKYKTKRHKLEESAFLQKKIHVNCIFRSIHDINIAHKKSLLNMSRLISVFSFCQFRSFNPNP